MSDPIDVAIAAASKGADVEMVPFTLNVAPIDPVTRKPIGNRPVLVIVPEDLMQRERDQLIAFAAVSLPRALAQLAADKPKIQVVHGVLPTN